MITKKEYIKQQVEGAWEDYKYITQILHDYFTDEVKDMLNEGKIINGATIIALQWVYLNYLTS